MKLSKYAKILGITYRIAWGHYKAGLIKGAYQLPTGTIIVPDEILTKKETTGSVVAIYTRVSSNENKDNLEGQAQRLKEYAIAKGYQIGYVVKEVGSGINDSRRKLEDLSSCFPDYVPVPYRTAPALLCRWLGASLCFPA